MVKFSLPCERGKRPEKTHVCSDKFCKYSINPFKKCLFLIAGRKERLPPACPSWWNRIRGQGDWRESPDRGQMSHGRLWGRGAVSPLLLIFCWGLASPRARGLQGPRRGPLVEGGEPGRPPGDARNWSAAAARRPSELCTAKLLHSLLPPEQSGFAGRAALAPPKPQLTLAWAESGTRRKAGLCPPGCLSARR